MFAILVEFTVAPEGRQALIAALVADGRGSLQDEPGTLRFDLHEDVERPGTLFLIEAYAEDDAFAAHQRGAHYLVVVEALEELRAKGLLSTRLISRTTPVFLAQAADWRIPE